MALKMSPAHLQRYRQIAMLLLRHGRGDLVRTAGIESLIDEETLEGDPQAAERLAADLEAMGPTFIKLGQLLSSRVDLLTPAYVDALSRLQDDVEPFPIEDVEEIIANELQVRLSNVFPTFDRTPLAAASLGQVHRATLRDGREVVVKVQRPGVRAKVLEDMEVLADLADTLDRHTKAGQRYNFSGLLEEFRKALIGELDYRREADNLATMRSLLDRHERIVVPEPYPDLTTDRVLTMEFVPGKKVTDLGPLGRLELDGVPLADQLFAAYLDQVLVHGVFHADPHPGNVLVTPDGRLVLLDIGMVARLAPAARDKLVKLLLALADAKPEDVTRVAMSMGEQLPGFDDVAFGRAVADVVGRASDAAVSDLDVGAMLLELTRRAGDAGLRMDPDLVMLGKTLLNLDQVATQLDPAFEPREALQRHMSGLMKSSMRTTPAAMMASVLEAKEFAEALPGRVNRAFDAIGEGNFELRIKAFDEDEFLRGLHKLANVLATAVVLAAMILASALLARPSGSGSSVENRIALVVFVVAVVVSLVMLARIAFHSRKVRANRRS